MLDRVAFESQRVLLLQGPVGPYFARLAKDLRRAGAEVHKINFNGGDQVFYPSGVPYTGTLEDWPEWLVGYMEKHQITCVALFGDRRPIHDGVAESCRERGIHCFVFEEGYFRPAYITCEVGGVNARSSIPRDPAFYRANATEEPVVEVPPPAHAYWAMVAWTCVYYLFGALLGLGYRHYCHHRTYRPTEAILWVGGSARKWWRKFLERGIEDRLATVLAGKYFLVPLQVHNDTQVTHNSRFGSVEAFITEVLTSFAQWAAPCQALVFKHHPMDRAYRNYQALIHRLGKVLGIEHRLLYIHDQHLPTLLDHAVGVVVINSTAGLSALHQGVPTLTLGDAFYDMPGLTAQVSLAEFWRAAPEQKPDHDLYLSFRRWVIGHTQINDNYYAGPLTGKKLNNESSWRAMPPRTSVRADQSQVEIKSHGS